MQDMGNRALLPGRRPSAGNHTVRRGLTRLLGCWAVAGLLSVAASPAEAQSAGVFTVSNYPVGATSSDAVSAKAQAMADGEQGAFRYLMKRLVGVAAYKRLPKLTLNRIEDMIEDVSVRGEQNSTTEYAATLEFRFKDRSVRELLRSYNLPFMDQQAGPLTVIPAYVVAPDTAKAKARVPGAEAGTRLWRDAWSGLDLVHALTPVRFANAGPSATPEVFARLARGDRTAFGVIEAEMRAERFIVALASPDKTGKKLEVRLIGRDWAGPISLTTAYRLDRDDPSYTAEQAAIIALGILEGRWKATHGVLGGEGGDVAMNGGAEGGEVLPWLQNGSGAEGSADPGAAGSDGGLSPSTIGGESLTFTAEFASMQQWQDIRGRLMQLPGLTNLQIGALSARSAGVSLSYPGGLPAFQSAAAGVGLQLSDPGGGTLVLRAL